MKCEFIVRDSKTPRAYFTSIFFLSKRRCDQIRSMAFHLPAIISKDLSVKEGRKVRYVIEIRVEMGSESAVINPGPYFKD